MKSAAMIVLALCAMFVLGQAGQGAIVEDHYLLHDDCEAVLNDQISWELYASIVYMNMAAYFKRPTVAQEGFAKFFKEQSEEEFKHAGAFIEFINSRNGTVRRIAIEESPKSEWRSPIEALTDAIKLEKHVYAKLQHIHSVAEQKCSDNHLMDFLESKFFTEQVNSIRDIQVMITTLNVGDKTAQSVIEHLEDERLHKEL